LNQELIVLGLPLEESVFLLETVELVRGLGVDDGN
jgi:hypothetical protein